MKGTLKEKKLTRLVLCALLMSGVGFYGPVAEAETTITLNQEPNADLPEGVGKNGNDVWANPGYSINFAYAGVNLGWNSYSLYGGLGAGDISNRTITISSTGTNNESSLYDVYGAKITDAENDRTANGNSVIINSGRIRGTVYGGYVVKGKATGNSVTIKSGAIINGNVYGGYAGASGEDRYASNNIVTIDGGTFSPTTKIYGGQSSTSGVNNNNTVNINTPIEVMEIWGSTNGGTGNILNLGAKNIIVSSDVTGVQTIAIKSGLALGGTILQAGNINSVNFLDVSQANFSGTGSITLLKKTGGTFSSIPVKGTAGTFTINNTTGQVVSSTAKNSEANGVTLAYKENVGTAKLSSDMKEVIYSQVAQSPVETVTLDAMTWDTGRSSSGFTYNGSTAIDASNLTFTGTANAPNDSMTLLSGATGITGNHITQPSTGKGTIAANFTDTAGINFVGTGKGVVSVGTGDNADKVLYTLNSGTLTNINLGGWDGTASNIPTNWTGSNVAVATGNFASEPTTNVDIFTTDITGLFNDDYITGNKKYQGDTTTLVNDTAKGVTLTGYKGGGVKATDSGTKLTYYKELMDTQSITLGEMTWGQGRTAASGYNFANIGNGEIDATNLTFMNPAAATGSMDLLSGAKDLQAGLTIVNPNHSQNFTGSAAANGATFDGTINGTVATAAEKITYTVGTKNITGIDLAGWNGNSTALDGWTSNLGADSIKAEGFTAPTLTAGTEKNIFTASAANFFDDNYITGAQKYGASAEKSSDTAEGVTLTGNQEKGVKASNNGQNLVYAAGTMAVTDIALGNMTWGTGRDAGTGYNFANVGDNGVDATNLKFTFTGTDANTLAAGTNMSLLTNATWLGADLAVKGSPVSQSISYGIDNVATLNGTLKGNVSTLAGTVNYTVTGKTLDSVDISGWNGTATATVDSSWSKAASGISVTGSGFVTPDTVGEYNILTSGSTGFFTGAKIDSSFAYQPSGTYSETAQNITLSGKQGKGVLANSEGTSLQYKIGEAYIDNIKLGAVTYSKDAVLLNKSGSLYNYSQLTSLDTSGFSLTMTDDQKKTAAVNDTMTLVKGNDTMGDIAAQSAGDSKYSYEATTGLTVGGTVSGSVSATGKNVVYQVTGNTASTLDVTSATWNTPYDRPDTEISYADAVVDSSNITFSGVDNLNEGDTMTLVSNYGNGVKKTRAGVFTLANGLKGKGTAYWDSDTDSLMYKVTLGAGETQATVDAVGGTEIFIQPDGGAPHQGTINGGEAKGGGTSKGNKTTVKGGVITNGDGTGGDVFGGTSEDGPSQENTADVEDSTIAGDVVGGQSDGGPSTENKAIVKDSTVGGDVDGGRSNGDGDTEGNEADVTGSTVEGDVNGGHSGGNGDSNRNVSKVDNSDVSGDVNGGKSDGNGDANENKTDVKNGSKVGGSVTGGQSEGGNTNKNETTVSGGSDVTGDVIGGKNNGNGTASENKTKVDGSTVGGSVVGGQSAGGDTNKNEATVTGGSQVTGNVLGGQTGGNGSAAENKATVEGSIVGGNVIGGQSENGTSSQNTASVTNSNVSGDVAGGYSVNGAVAANTASVTGGSVGGSVYGGQTDGAQAAASNTVTLDGGAVINGAVYGGYSENGTAEGNVVNVKNATIRDYIYGGKSKIRSSNDLVYFHDGSVLGIIGGGCDEAISNSVTLMKGGVEEHVIGGYATTTATGNKVTLTGGTVQGSVIGGYGNGTASENSVYLGGGTVQGNTIDSATLGITIDGGVYGGYGTGATRNNSVYLYSTADVSNTSLFGGTSEATGNILNIGYDGAAWTGGGQNVKNISNFENIKYSVLPWSSSKAAVTITDGTASNLSAATVSAPQVTITGVKTLSTGDTMTLLDQSKVAAANQAIKVKENSNFTIGIAAEGTGLLSRDEQGNVIYKVDSIKATEQTHNTVMASAAGMAALTTGNDYIGAAGEGLFHPENIGADGLACYAKIGGGKLRQETGSHVNVNTWNAILAVGRKSEHKDSTFEYGAFVEYGKGNFSTFNENSQRGDGSVNYTGAGLLGKWTTKNGLYVDGSFRAGRIHESASNLLRDDIRGYGYNERSSYLGFSLGIGKQFEAAHGDVVDVYGRYIFNRKGSMDFNAAGDDYNLDAINSHIFRLGVRYTMKRDRWKFYGDLSYEHEFDGKAEGRVNGLTIRGADTSGGSARWSLNFDVTGYAGKKQGVKGGVSLTYMF